MPDARRREPGLIDLLTWDLFVGEGLLRCVDGALVAMFRYRGPDLDSATAEELTGLSRLVADTLDLLGDGWIVHSELQRLAAPAYPAGASFPDPVTRALDEERRLHYGGDDSARFESRYVLTLAHLPAGLSRPWKLLTTPPGEEELLVAERRQREGFEAAVGEVSRQLASPLRLERLSSREMLRCLQTCLTGLDQPINIPPYPVTLESLLGAGDLHGGCELRLGEHHIVPVSILNYPEATTPAGLAFLDELALPFRAVVRYLPLDRYTAKREIGRIRRRWSTATVSLRHFVAFAFGGGGTTQPKFTDRHAPRMADDADDAIDELDRDETSSGYLTATILTWSTDRAAALDAAQLLVKEARNAGYVAMLEEYNALEAWLGSLPAHGHYNCRRPIVSHRAFADLAPTTAVWTGQADNPHPALAGQGPCVVCSTEGATPFFWSLASRDVQHALVAGPIGAGKSTLVNLLIAQYLRYPDAQVFSFDKGWSQYALCRAAGGHHYAPSADRPDSEAFAPLAHVEQPGERTRAADWIEELLHLQGLEVTPAQRQAVVRALELLGAHRTLAGFAAKVQDRVVRQALAPYAEGPYAPLFGASRSPLRDGPLHVIEMEALLPLRTSVLSPLMVHLFGEIESRLDGRPTLIIVEEAPNYLGDTLWARRLRQWLLELRKRNAGVVFVTQLLGSFLESELRDAVLENCPIRILLPNAAARDPHAAEAYQAFGLSARQIEVIATAVPRRDYYLDTPEGSRLIQLGLTSGSLALLGASGPRTRDQVDRLEVDHGSEWPAALLREQGHQLLAGLVETASGHPTTTTRGEPR